LLLALRAGTPARLIAGNDPGQNGRKLLPALGAGLHKDGESTVNILLDSCVWGGARAEIVAAGHDVIWAGDWTEDPGDEEILARAHAEGRVLVTADKDFGELAIVRGQPHSGILRLVNIPARRQAAVCLQILTRYGEDLAGGALITADRGRVRVRLPEPPAETGEGETLA
jgi:predicted nuclease of predicted toxin-antitoxin system